MWRETIVRKARRVGSPVGWTGVVLLGVLLALLAIGGLAYYSYVQARELSQTQRNFRHLAGIGKNLREAAEAYKTIFYANHVVAHKAIFSAKDANQLSAPRWRYSWDDWKELSPADRRDVDARLQDAPCLASDPVKFNQLPEGVALRAQSRFFLSGLCDADALKDVGITYARRERTSITVGRQQEGERKEAAALALTEDYRLDRMVGDRLDLSRVTKAEEGTSYRIFVDTADSRALRLEVRSELKFEDKKEHEEKIGSLIVTTGARLRLRSIVEKWPLPEQFTDVLIAEETGRVLYHHEVAGRVAMSRFTDLQSLLGATTPNVSARTGSAQERPNPQPVWAQLPLRKDVVLGDRTYYLFAQGVLLDSKVWAGAGSTEREEPLKLIVAALVPAEEFEWAAKKIPRHTTRLLIVAGLGLTFALPLIKLVSMGPQDRMGFADAMGSKFFAILGIALCGLVAGVWMVHGRLGEVADDKLAGAAQEIREAFDRELTAAVKRLHDYGTGMEIGLCGNPGGDSRVNYPPVRWSSSFSVPPSGCRKAPILRPPEPFVQTLLWADRNGKIEHLESIRRRPITPPNISKRKFVLDVLQNKDLKTLDHGDTAFAIQPVMAWDDGEFGTMLAMGTDRFPAAPWCSQLRVKEDNAQPIFSDAGPKYVVAMRVQFYSLVDTVLPTGYHYAVIDPTGDVLYHSDSRRNLRENFYRETDENRQLIGVVEHKFSDRVQATYHGNAQGTGVVMDVRPLHPHLDWALVVYRDTRWINWVTEQAILIAGILFTLYVVVFVGAIFVFVLYPVLRVGRAEWLWPRESQVWRYGWLIGLNVFLIAAGTFPVWWNEWPLGQGSALWVCAVVVLAVMSIVIVLREKGPAPLLRPVSTDPHSSILSANTRWAYTALATTSVLVIALVPGATFLKIGYSTALGMYGTYAAKKFCSQPDEEAARRERFYRNLPEYSVKDALSHTGNVYWRVFFPTKPPWIEGQYCSSGGAAIEKSQAQIKDLYLSRLHLWADQPGRELGAWVEKGAISSLPIGAMFFGEDPAGRVGVSAWAILVLCGSTVTLLIAWRWERKKDYLAAFGLYAVSVLSLWLFIWVRSSPWGPHVSVMLGSMLVVGVAYASQRAVARYLFHLDMAEPKIGQAEANLGELKHVLMVIPSSHWPKWIAGPQGGGAAPIPIQNSSDLGTWLAAHGWHVIDIPRLMEAFSLGHTHPLRALPQHDDGTKAIAVIGLDHRITEPPQQQILLALAERLALTPSRSTLYISHRHPFDPEIVPSESAAIPVQDKSVVLNRERWAHALRECIVIPFSGRTTRDDHMLQVQQVFGDPNYLCTSQWQQWVQEVRRDESATDTVQHVDALLTKRAAERYALGVLRCRYEYWWAESTPSERLALWHVASGHFLHASNSKLYLLVWKGLLRFAPDLRVCSRSFQAFILQVADRDGIDLIAQDLRPSRWAVVSRPLVGLLVSGVIFLAVTQEGARDIVLSLIPALPVILVEIPRLLSSGGGVPAGGK